MNTTTPNKVFQELYNRMFLHLLAQNERAINIHGCAYRGEENLQCAVGCLIKDEYYDESLEGKSPFRGVLDAVLKSLPKEQVDVFKDNDDLRADLSDFLYKCQHNLHDDITDLGENETLREYLIENQEEILREHINRNKHFVSPCEIPEEYL